MLTRRPAALLVAALVVASTGSVVASRAAPDGIEVLSAGPSDRATNVSTLASMTIEDLLDSHALSEKTEAALRARYLVT